MILNGPSEVFIMQGYSDYITVGFSSKVTDRNDGNHHWSFDYTRVYKMFT